MTTPTMEASTMASAVATTVSTTPLWPSHQPTLFIVLACAIFVPLGIYLHQVWLKGNLAKCFSIDNTLRKSSPLQVIAHVWRLQVADWTAGITGLRSPQYWTVNSLCGTIALTALVRLAVELAQRAICGSNNECQLLY